MSMDSKSRLGRDETNTMYMCHNLRVSQRYSKGQIKPKADLGAVHSPKKERTNLGFFAVKNKKATKTNSFLRFLGESAARQSAFACSDLFLILNF